MALPEYTYSGVAYQAPALGSDTFNLLTSPGGIAIPFLEPSHIHVYTTIDGGESLVELTRPAGWDFNAEETQVILATPLDGATDLIIRRVTPKTGQYVTFQPGRLNSTQLNDAALFNLYLLQEFLDLESVSGTINIAELEAELTALTAQVQQVLDDLQNAETAVDQVSAADGIVVTQTGPADLTVGAVFANDADAVAGDSLVKVMNPDKTRHMLDTKPPGVPVAATASGGRTLSDADKGLVVPASNGGWTVPSTLSPGTAVTLLNASGLNQTVTQGAGVTLYHSLDGATGNRTLGLRGMATVVCVASGVCYIAGAGLE